MSQAEFDLRTELAMEDRQKRFDAAVVAFAMSCMWRDEARKAYKQGDRKKAKQLRAAADAKIKETDAFLEKKPLDFPSW